jgi:hypothetical protein
MYASRRSSDRGEKTSSGQGNPALGWVVWDDFGVSIRDEFCDLLRVLDSGPDAGSALEAVCRLRVLVDEELLVQVGRARRDGMSWGGIGEALGVSPQAVHKRFAWLV